MGEAAERGKEKWPQVRLGDVCDDKITSISSKENFDIIYIDISSIDNKTKCISSYTKIPAKKAPSRAKQILKLNDILVSTVRPNLNAVAINTLDEDTVVVGSTGYCVLRSTEKIENKYLFYFCQSPTFIEQLVKRAKGASYPAVSNVDVKNIQIPLPPLPEQRRIAAVLDQVSSLIALRKAQLAKLDLLVKARFVEMFGEPSINPMSWPIKNIATILDGKVSNGFFAKREAYTAEGNVSVLGVANVVNRMYSQCNNLPKTNGTQKDIDKYSVKYGDILFCRSSLVAEGIGKASIVPKEIPQNVLFECHIIRMQLDLSKCVPEYIQVLTTTDYFRQQIISQSKTATMTTIGQDGILKSNIILPPLSLQKEFLEFIEQTNKSKSEIQQGLIQLESLKKSLMQEYFG